MVLLGLFLASTILALVLSGLTFLFFAYLRKIDTDNLRVETTPLVSVIVPARNEAEKIGRCLESLARQDYPNYEVIAVDDKSTDDTGAIIAGVASRHEHVKHVKGTPTPVGWIGKCNALVTAMEHASGEWLIFSDADTCHTPESVRYAVNYAMANKAEFLSFMPVQELGSFWERLVMPVLLGSFICGDPLNTLNEHTNDRAYAYGQYILIRRDVYEAVGGHYAVRDQILDDISLARVVKAHGHHIMTADGRPLYSVRMYTDFESLWQGWTKNLYSLIDCNFLYLLIVISLINSCVVAPYVEAPLLAWMWATGDTAGGTRTVLTLLCGLQFGLLWVWYKRNAEHYTGVDFRDFLMLPLGSLAVNVLYMHSAYLVLSGTKVNWKGRQYTVNSSASIKPESGPRPHEAAAEARARRLVEAQLSAHVELADRPLVSVGSDKPLL